MGKLNKTGLELKRAFKIEMKANRAKKKAQLKSKRARLIVTNLSFSATAENIKELFEKHGEVENVNMLKKEDGKLVGCAFVQFKLVQKAAKARHYLNNQPFLGRNMSVDFALPKDKYNKEKKEKEKLEIKKEKDDVDLSIVKIEDENNGKKEEDELEINENLYNGNDCDDSNQNSDSEEDDSDIEEDKNDIEIEEVIPQKPRVISNDVVEGKTVFVQNVPFDATGDDLKDCMSQFGPLHYALICMDKLTEHAKGTGFVKFWNKEDAEKCLQAGTELTLMGNILDCHLALHRNEMKQKEMEKKKDIKDSRNLYLVKEGVILAGTPAAEGVSQNDMAKRLQLEQYKTQMLRNLNMYVSRNRLVVHNLPPTWNDNQLRSLIKKHSSPNAAINETRIMRDRRNVDMNGVGKSKEYGFVTFTNHEDALKVFRSLNNNPNIFSAQKRPIVTFSIENKSAIRGKEKRMQISRVKNPLCKDFVPTSTQTETQSKKIKRRQIQAAETKKYTGIEATPGARKMRSRHNLKSQAELHSENIKKEKKKQKINRINNKSLKQKRAEFTKQERQKINKKKDNDSFSNLVNKYKQNLMSTDNPKKQKWYE